MRSKGEPKVILIGTGTFRVGSLVDWDGWDTGLATASGFIRLRQCVPDCIRGGFIKRRAAVTLSKVRSICGQLRYSNIKITVKNGPEPVLGPFGTDCTGWLTF